MRFLLILIAVTVLVLSIRMLLKKTVTKSETRQSNSEPMVPCKQCNLHIPKSEAVRHAEQFFCCDAHYKKWQNEHNIQ